MANTAVQLAAPSGLAGLTLTLHAAANLAVASPTTVSLTELGNAGVYQATVAAALSGLYRAQVFTASGAELADGWITLADDAGPHHAVASRFEAERLDVPVSSVGGSAAPAGDHTLTVTVTDAADDSPLEARVSILASGSRYHVGLSDAGAGELAVAADDGTYTVLAVLPGYTAAPASVQVAGADAAIAISMTQTVARPDPGDCTVVFTVRRGGSLVGAGKKIWPRLVGDAGVADPIAVGEVGLTTGGDSTAEDGLRRGATYQVLELDASGYAVLVDEFVVLDADVMTREVEVFFA